MKSSGWIARLAALAVLLTLTVGPAFAQSNKFSFSQRNQKKMIKIVTLIQEGDPKQFKLFKN